MDNKMAVDAIGEEHLQMLSDRYGFNITSAGITPEGDGSLRVHFCDSAFDGDSPVNATEHLIIDGQPVTVHVVGGYE